MQDDFHMKYQIIDNPGAGHCAFYAFLIGLMPILQEAHAAAQGCPALKPYMLLKKKVTNAPDNILTPDQKSNFLKNCLSFNYNNPDQNFLQQGNVFLRWLIHDQAQKALDDYVSGQSKECPQIITDALALLEYGITGKATDTLETDVGRNEETKKEILKISEHIKIIYGSVGAYVKNKLETEYQKLEQPNERRKFLIKLLFLDDFSDLNHSRTRLFEEFNYDGFGDDPWSDQQIAVIDRYFLGYQTGNHSDAHKHYIENGQRIPNIADPGFSLEQRNIIQRYAQYRCAQLQEALIASCVDSKTLTKEKLGAIIHLYLARERNWDIFKCKLIIEKEWLVDSLKNVIKNKEATAEWGVATELAALAKMFQINLKIQKSTDVEPISVHGNSDAQKKSELCLKHVPGHWLTLIKQSSDGLIETTRQRLQQ